MLEAPAVNTTTGKITSLGHGVVCTPKEDALRSMQQMIENVGSQKSRDEITRLIIDLGALLPQPKPAEALPDELARLSDKKLNEKWSARPAQLQVLRNIFHGVTPKVTRLELQAIKDNMNGRQLRDVATVAMSVLATMREEAQ